MIRAVLTALLLVAAPRLDAAGLPASEVLQQVRFDQRLGETVDPDLTFFDSIGNRVRMGDYLGDRPVLITMGYYRCPQLCSIVFNGLVQALQQLPFVAGADYEWVVVSIDPDETPELARKKKATYAARYAHDGAADGWHFLVGDPQNINRLADTIGFRYAHDPETGQYAHPAGIVVLTPDGMVSKYFFGTDFDPGDLRLGMVDASAGKLGSAVDQVLLRCYQYDPSTGQYGFAVMTAVRAAGVLTVLVMAGGILWLLRRERRSRREVGIS